MEDYCFKEGDEARQLLCGKHVRQAELEFSTLVDKIKDYCPAKKQESSARKILKIFSISNYTKKPECDPDSEVMSLVRTGAEWKKELTELELVLSDAAEDENPIYLEEVIKQIVFAQSLYERCKREYVCISVREKESGLLYS